MTGDLDYASVWSSLPREERSAKKLLARRGQKATTKPDAALVVWHADRQLRRGPWPTLALSAGVVLVVVGLLVATGQLSVAQIFGNPILAIIVLVPFAAWPSQRRSLQKALRANIGVLTGKIPEEVPTATEVGELLARPKISKLLRRVS